MIVQHSKAEQTRRSWQDTVFHTSSTSSAIGASSEENRPALCLRNTWGFAFVSARLAVVMMSDAERITFEVRHWSNNVN